MAHRIVLPLGRLPEHKPAHPERTGYRKIPFLGPFADYEIKEWPSRAALLETIRMQTRLGADFTKAYRVWDYSKEG